MNIKIYALTFLEWKVSIGKVHFLRYACYFRKRYVSV